MVFRSAEDTSLQEASWIKKDKLSEHSFSTVYTSWWKGEKMSKNTGFLSIPTASYLLSYSLPLFWALETSNQIGAIWP